MKRLVVLALLGAAAVGCSDSFTAPPDGATFAPSAAKFSRTPSQKIAGRYIVVFRNSVTDVDGAARSIVARHGGRIRHTYKSALRGLALELSDSAVTALRAEPSVAYVEQDQTVSASATQTGADWGLDRMDQRSLPLDGSFSWGSDGSGVNAYIVDTGINLTHTEFGGRAVSGVDEITAGGSATDCNGHGTHVAGTVGGATFGVAKNVKLFAVRVLDCSGNGSSSGVIAGLDWVTANRRLPAVANLSLGGDFSQALNDAVERTIAAGVTVVVAAGNSAADACTSSPSSAPDAITTGATDNFDTFASFSNYGSCVKLNAPGVNIASAWIGSNSATASASGTSMASPHVAGAAAAYLQANPSATPTQVRSALVGAATSGAIRSIGAGTVNLLLFSAPPAPAPAPAPAPSGAQFSENWSSGVVGSAWVVSSTGVGAASVVNGALVVGSASGGDASIAVSSASSYSLDAAGDAGVVLKFAPTATARYNSVMVVDANGNGFGAYFYAAAGYLVLGDVRGGVVQEGTYVTNAMPGYLRIRKSGANYAIDVSPDGTTWTQRRSTSFVPGTITTALRLRFTSNGWGNSGSWSSAYDDIVWGGSGVTPSPAPPVARLSANCSGLNCTFDASSSTAAAGASFAWRFGDGATGSGVTTSHNYASAGTYTVTLIVADANGRDSSSRAVTVASQAGPQLAETWSSGSLGSNWIAASTGVGAVSVVSNELYLGSNIGGDAMSTVTTVGAYSLDAAGDVGVTLRFAPTATARHNSVMVLDANGNGFGAYYYSGSGYLVLGDVRGGVVQEGTYVTNAMPGYLRFRKSGSNYSIDVSSDGFDWTQKRSAPLMAGTVTAAMKLRFEFDGWANSGSWSASYDDIFWH